MTNLKLIKKSLIGALAAILYIVAISLLMSNIDRIFIKADNPIFSGITMLLLLVLSATTMGFIIFGRPLLIYLDGFKKEALKLFYLTVAWLVLITIIVFFGLIIF